MADFPYSPQPSTLKRFLEHVQSAGVPDKVSQKYLEKVGFKSKNDRYIIGVLKFLGFLDNSGTPVGAWQAYRNRSSAKKTLGAAIRKSYGDLFKTYPDAHRKDNEALRNYFSAHTKVAESTLGLIVTTFKTLCGLAEFDGDESVLPEVEASAGPETLPPPSTERQGGSLPSVRSATPAVNINIQLELPATENGEIYEKLFAAMKKHLFS